MTGRPCVAGIDYATVTDLVSANLHFREGDTRYDINHSWLCLKSKDLHRLKIPWRELAQAGHITLVDNVEVHPDIVCEWLLKQGQRYNILKLALDNYRYALMTNSLRGIGFDANEAKNVKLTRPSDVTAIVPVIDTFLQKNCLWGDNLARGGRRTTQSWLRGAGTWAGTSAITCTARSNRKAGKPTLSWRWYIP